MIIQKQYKTYKIAILFMLISYLSILPSYSSNNNEIKISLFTKIINAPYLTTKDICIPVKSATMEGPFFVPNPDGMTYDIILLYYKDYNSSFQFISIDCSTGEIVKDSIPFQRYVHNCGKALGSDGKYYFSIYSKLFFRTELWSYDSEFNKLAKINKNIYNLGGEIHPLVTGTDGNLYGGGTRNKTSSIFQYNIKNRRIKDYGTVGPSHAPLRNWCYTIAADDNFIYAASGKRPWYLIVYDKSTGKDNVILTKSELGSHIQILQHDNGCSGWVKDNHGSKRKLFWLYKGRIIWKEKRKEISPWFSKKNKQTNPAIKPELFLANTSPLNNSECQLWYRNPGSKKNKVTYNVDTYNYEINRIMELQDNRIFGTAGSYLGNFIYDPRKNKCEHLGKIKLSHYATVIDGNKIYMSGYPSSALYIYDLLKPWTGNKGKEGEPLCSESDNKSNPKFLTWLAKHSMTHKMFAGEKGADGNIYFGGKQMRIGKSGGLAWWNPVSQTGGGLTKPFRHYQISYMAKTKNSRFLILSTSVVPDLKGTKTESLDGRLFIFDTDEKKIVKTIDPIKKSKSSGLITGLSKNRILGMTYDPDNPNHSTILYCLDINNDKLILKKKIPFKLPIDLMSNQIDNFDFRKGPEGFVWTYINKCLVRINPDNFEIDVIGKIRKTGKIAFSNNDIYIANEHLLKKVLL